MNAAFSQKWWTRKRESGGKNTCWPWRSSSQAETAAHAAGAAAVVPGWRWWWGGRQRRRHDVWKGRNDAKGGLGVETPPASLYVLRSPENHPDPHAYACIYMYLPVFVCLCRGISMVLYLFLPVCVCPLLIHAGFPLGLLNIFVY